MSSTARVPFDEIPGRILLDTCIINTLYAEGGYIFDADDAVDASDIDNLDALRIICQASQRAAFQMVISPLCIMEIANIQDTAEISRRLSWVLELQNHWVVMLDEMEDRAAQGGTVRHRFKLTPNLQTLESKLLEIPDFKRDPLDRLLLVQYKMANCDAFMTTDQNTILRHRDCLLTDHGIRVVTPVDYMRIIEPWLAIWC